MGEKKNHYPLHDAAGLDDLTEAKRCIAAGYDVNALDDDGLAPLHWAATGGSVEMLKLLLDHGANPNLPVFEPIDTKDKTGRRRFGLLPLHFAVSVGWGEENAAYLVSRGADPHLEPNASDGTPMDWVRDVEKEHGYKMNLYPKAARPKLGKGKTRHPAQRPG